MANKDNNKTPQDWIALIEKILFAIISFFAGTGVADAMSLFN